MISNSLKSLILSSRKIILIDLRKCCLQTNIESSLIPKGFDQKLLKVAVVGMPNAGKSTFINNLMDRRACPTSSKVHTTRGSSRAIFMYGNSQIVFLDTPGLVNDRERKKYKLENSFIKDSALCSREADIIGVIHDVSDPSNREKLDVKVINLLEENKGIPSFLVLNKIDVLKSKRKLLDITRILTENRINGKICIKNKVENPKMRGWPHFSEIFMVSSIQGSGLQDVKEYLANESKPKDWMFPIQVWSDQTAEKIIVDTVKAKLLDFLPQEIPYTLKPYVELFDIDERGVIKTVVLVKCPSERISKLVGGISNGRLRQIIESVQDDLQSAFQNVVRINIVLNAPQDGKS